MIDSVFILSFGGVVLWSYCVGDESAGVLGGPPILLNPLHSSILSGSASNSVLVTPGINVTNSPNPHSRHMNRLVGEVIRTVLIEERPTNEQQGLLLEDLRFRWIRVATLNLMFLVASFPLVEGEYICRLLELLRDEFMALLPAKLQRAESVATAATELNGDALKYTTNIQAELVKLTASSTSFERDFKSKFFDCLKRCDNLISQRTAGGKSKSTPGSSAVEPGAVESLRNGNSSSQPDELKAGDPTSKGKGFRNNILPKNKSLNGVQNPAPGKHKKTPATWAPKKVSKQTMGKLDFSADKHKLPASPDVVEQAVLDSDRDWEKLEASSSELESTSEDESIVKTCTSYEPAGLTNNASTVRSSGFFGRISAAFANLTGNSVLEKENLAPVLEDFKTQLVTKGVANEVAIQLCSSVECSLLGKRTESFTSVRRSVRAALSETVERILTQNRPVDILKSALDAKARGSVYTICFLGVNGVGKSTNLAKVAYLLKHKAGLRVMIAACDTFRSGAVEQLQTHARNLGLEVYEQGYGRDAAHICKQAVQHATSSRYDVVLIDTAGRMQDNEPLMRSLANLVALNSPNLILFVGEALVGNDAVDQLQKFNTSLQNFAPHTGSSPRSIDGIILTKFDTVDDKVGAALSMAYVSGQPIVFVGTGQKYTNLQTLKVSSVLKSLLG